VTDEQTERPPEATSRSEGAPGAPTSRGGSPHDERHPGRSAFAIAQLYYYVAAVIGMGFLVGGAITALSGVRQLILPQADDTHREAVRQILHGAAFVLPGAATLWWHLREATRREHRPFAPAFWGRALYFHLVALVALAFVMGGVVSTLAAAADATLPQCYEAPVPVPEPVPFPVPPPSGIGLPAPSPPGFAYLPLHPGRVCVTGDATARVANGGVILLVAVPVWLWHLRLGRRATAPPRSTTPPPSA